MTWELMVNPPHPGRLLKRTLVASENKDVRCNVASDADITQAELQSVLDANASITPAIARSLEKNDFSTANFWLNLQKNFDGADHV